MKKFVVLTLAVLPVFAFAGIALNPDVRQDTLQQTVCISGYTATVRPAVSYTEGVKKKLLRQRNLDWSHAHEFELDHIVPLELGGHPRDLKNLQLQAWDGPRGAHVKDHLENKLHCMVCAGQIPLAKAQREIYKNWEATAAKYESQSCVSHTHAHSS